MPQGVEQSKTSALPSWARESGFFPSMMPSGNMQDFRVPELGEGVYEAELVSWLVKVGDTVKRGQNLMEVLTDKATMEVPAPFAGTISALHAEPGQKIKVGDRVLSYTPTGQGSDGVAGRQADKGIERQRVEDRSL